MIQTKARSYLLKTKYKYFHHEQRIIFYPHGLHFHLIQYILTPLISGFYHSLLPLLTSPPGYPVTSFNSHYTSPFTKIQFSWRRPSWKPLPNLTSQSALIFLGDLPLLGSYWENSHLPKPRISTNLYAKDSHRFLMVSTIISSYKISILDLQLWFIFWVFIPDCQVSARHLPTWKVKSYFFDHKLNSLKFSSMVPIFLHH